MNNIKAGIGCLGAVLIFGFFAMLTMFVTVPAGSVGVVTVFGEVKEETLPAGGPYFLFPPLVNQVHILDTRVQSHEFGVADGLPIEAASSEYQAVYLSGKFNYHVDGAFASVLYRTVGEDFANRIIDPAFKDIVKEIVPTYSISQILPKRDEIRQKTIDLLNANLARYHIIIDDVYLANVSFSPEYEASIEAKQVAQQQVETEREILRQLEIKKQQRVVEAQGIADAAIESARGTAEANRLIDASLTQILIQFQSIQKLNPNVQVIYLPESGNFIFQMPEPKQP